MLDLSSVVVDSGPIAIGQYLPVQHRVRLRRIVWWSDVAPCGVTVGLRTGGASACPL